MTTVLLVVDDEADIRLLARLVFESASYEVREAASGAEAISTLEDPQIGVVLLDLRMSPLDGWDVLEHLRAKHRLPDLPVVMVSAHADPTMASRALELGCASYMNKPFDPAELLATVGAAVQARQ